MDKPYVVVAGTDFSKDASRALTPTYAQACREAPAKLHVLHTAFAVAVPPTDGNQSPRGATGAGTDRTGAEADLPFVVSET
jgi:hypothetical protein